MAISNTIREGVVLGFRGLAIFSVAFCGGFIMGTISARSPENVLTCSFKNMTAKYSTTQAEAESQTIMITVTQANRTFMFRRDNLTACYDANETP